MISCEELVIADGQVVRQLLKDFNVFPESMLPLNSFDEFEKRLQYDKNLAKTYGNLKNFISSLLQPVSRSYQTILVASGFLITQGEFSSHRSNPLDLFLWVWSKTSLASFKMKCQISRLCVVSWIPMSWFCLAQFVSPITHARLILNSSSVTPAPCFSIINAFFLK